MTITTDSLVQKVDRVVDDDSYKPAFIISQFNAGYREIAGRVLLRDLQKTDTVTTTGGQNYVALPADYHRHLSRWVYSVTNDSRLKYYKGIDRLFMQFEPIDAVGSVIGVARAGANLYIQPVPAGEEIIRIVYYAYPTVIASGGNIPAGIPEHLMEPLLVNYAAWKIMEQWEDGIEQEKVNTTYHLTIFEKALNDLREYLGYPRDDRGLVE